jgi:hypothetical protein
MDELPADVRDQLNEHYGVGNYRAWSRAEGDVLVLLVERPSRESTWSVVRPWTIERTEAAWRTFAANLIAIEVRP